ncbi:MerR family transcriptional regulator [Salicibibacter cibi]|uniref:MerR family transcriptional regulator n=1 Tax=Salicibibacter cibi TaxID=2743001 RepID=A0A7T6ZAI6_9BACI|nr:MerR family transcriptional regulator [Salicibibacter cibi]QQK79929.1 MerR family transcriptional regulator [Salicibibacter cibi]
MATLVKTKNVAEVLRVAPKTVQTWVRKYQIPVQTNDRGHYLYDHNSIDRLRTVKSTQMPEEKEPFIEREAKPTYEEAEKRMDDILRRLDHLENMIEQKADEVVSFQLLKHRQELDDVQCSLAAMEKDLKDLQVEKIEPERRIEGPKKERGKLANMFLFSS